MGDHNDNPEGTVKSTGKDEDSNLGRLLKGTYELTKKVGEGGMGNVYLATQQPLNREVAIKLVKPTDNNPEGEHYFMREVQAINMLRHPNIINIVDFGKEVDDGSLFLVMEFLPGKTLKRVIRKEHPLAPERISRICIQILSALESAHTKEIVHCDLKPANIMLEEVAGQSDFVKVLDFGIAKIKGPAMEVGPYTQAGNIVGTFDYMSPEQIMRKDLDGRADLWSMGVIIYEMLTRKRIFHDKDAVSIIGRVMQMPIEPPIDVLGPDLVPPLLNDIIIKAMQRNVAKRFRDAAEMRHALEQLRDALRSGSIPAVRGSNLDESSSYGSITGSGPFSGNEHSGSLAGSGLLRGTHMGIQSNARRVGPGSSTNVSSIVSRSGSFGSMMPSTRESSRMATGIAAGTSVLDQTFSIDALQDSLTGERRKVAVLAIQQRARRRSGIDPEELARRSKQEAKIIQEVVLKHEGEIDSFLGGTYTILFGARKSRVGDNLRAVECALQLSERLKLLEQGYEHFGLGLSYGEVFLSSRKGGNAFGESIDRAVEIARSVTEAKVLVSEELIALTRRQVAYDAPRQIAGESVSQVLSILDHASSEQEAQDAEVLTDVAIYVPRPLYFDELVRRGQSTQARQGGGVALVGEMGVGKSVLIDHFCKEQVLKGWHSFYVRESELVPSQACAPERAWIRMIAMTYKDPRTLIRKACESIGLKQSVDRVVSLYLNGSSEDAHQLWGDPGGFAHFTAALFHRMVRFAMKKGAVLLAVDQLDTSDTLCMEMIHAFVGQMTKFPLLVLTGHRIESQHHHMLPDSFEVMIIEGFEVAESRQFISQLLGYTPPPEVVHQLHERASGNPMFLKELMRALIHRIGAQALTNEQNVLDAGIPLNLQELLAQRIDALPDHLRDLIAIASILGESFREEFFYQITPAHLAPQLGLKELVALTLFEARQDPFGRVQIGFNPRALRKVAYERLPRETRLKLHSSVIEFLEQAPEVAAVDDLERQLMLAFHYRSLEGFDGAAHYLTQAGKLLLNLYDYNAAIEHLLEARDLIKSHPPNHPMLIEALRFLLIALRESGRIEEAQQLIHAMPPMDEIEPQFRADLLLEVGHVSMEAGSLGASTEAFSSVVRLAQEQNYIKLEVKALLAFAQLFEKENQLSRAASVLVEVSRKVELLGDLDMHNPDDRKLYWTAYNQLGTLSLREKNIEQAQKYLQVAFQRAQKIQDHRGMVRIISNIGALFLSVRDTVTAERYFQQAVEIARATGDLINQSRILTNMGITSFEANALEKSKDYYKQALSIAEEIGWYEGLAELSLRIKQLRQAMQH